jgi:iron(III) transport system permease protein
LRKAGRLAGGSPGAALLSLLMAVALFAWWLQKRLVGEKEVTSVTGKPGRTSGRRWAG